ncbi:MAG: ScpA family protein, partial [Alphaproteobacteria bacterium]
MTDETQPQSIFEADDAVAGGAGTSQMVVDLEGFEGPIDVLLTLAREQKVDITRISILRLADQYLAFITAARRVRLELAADYLVMAAWLAYLKSRLLLPVSDDGEEPTGEQMAEALAFQLRRLEAMQDVGARLMARPLVGREVFYRGSPEGIEIVTSNEFTAELYDLLQAYGALRARGEGGTLHISPSELYSIEDAFERLSHLLGRIADWQTLSTFLPQGVEGGLLGRSALASTLAAS